MPTLSLTHRLIPADFLTHSYRIVGEIRVSSAGLMGLINDPTTTYLDIQNARLARIYMPNKLLECFQLLRLVKKQVLAVCLTRREDIGPQAQARMGFARVTSFPVFLSTSVYELSGTLEWAGRFDFSAIITEGPREFIPLYEASLRASLIPSVIIEAPALVFNRGFVEALGLIEQRCNEEADETPS